MASRTRKLILPAVQAALIAALVFNGCTCAEDKPPTQPAPPAPAAPVAAVPTAAAPAAAPQVATAANDLGGAPSPTPAPEGSPLADAQATVSARRSVCDTYVGALSGRPEDAKLLAQPEVKALAKSAPELAICGAVAADSDELCKLVGEDRAVNCRYQWSIFHELRANPKGRGFMFTPFEEENCKTSGPPAEFCTALRTAVSTGDPDRCPKGDSEYFCRAAATGDKRLCAKITGEKDLIRDCERGIQEKSVYAKGLSGLAQSGSPEEQRLAKAAMGQADACAPYAQAALGACAANVEGMPVDRPGTPVAGAAGAAAAPKAAVPQAPQ